MAQRTQGILLLARASCLAHLSSKHKLPKFWSRLLRIYSLNSKLATAKSLFCGVDTDFAEPGKMTLNIKSNGDLNDEQTII